MTLLERLIGFGKQAVEGYVDSRREGKSLTEDQVQERVEKDLVGTLCYVSAAVVGTSVYVFDEEATHFRMGYGVALAKYQNSGVIPPAAEIFENTFSDRTSYHLGVLAFETQQKIKNKLRGE